MLKRLFFPFLFVLLAWGCKNDLQVNAPYKEMPAVYAVLSPQEKIHVIKINKVFLGEGDANMMAKVADSVNYPEGELEVTLTRYVNNGQVNATPDDGGQQTIFFKDSVSDNLVPGAFSTTQRLYVSNKKIYTSGLYKLTIRNKHTGNVFTAKANSLDSLNGNQGFRPMTTVPSYPYPPFTSPSEYIDYATYPGVVRFVPDKVAKIYQNKIRTHFYDSSG